MERKKISEIFNSLEPRSAMILGIASGVMVICTIGFIILSSIALSRGLNCTAGTNKTNKTDNVATGGTITPPIAQAPKSDKPVVELFIMTYCPYGLQMQKAYLPVMDLLSKKADMSVKYVSYAMHDKIEIDENTRQYCIEKEQNAKYIAYTQCFVATDDSSSCLKQAKVNESQLSNCMQKTDKEFKITEYYKDKSSWLSGRYPIYPVHSDLNDLYQVAGSPTLVINGQQVDSVRSPEAIKQTICAAFNQAPEECNEILNSQSAGAGFGNTVGANTDASCG